MIVDGHLPSVFRFSRNTDGTDAGLSSRLLILRLVIVQIARLLHVEDESRYPVMSIALDADEAALVTEILLRLSSLIDSDDPDGLRTASGQRSDALEAQMLTDTQFTLLRRPLYMASQRANVAARLRMISAKIEGQLPPEAPDIMR